MSDEQRELGAFVIMIICAVVAILAIAVIIGSTLDRASCYANWHDSGMESRWGLLSGCQIDYQGYWTPARNYVLVRGTVQ